MSVFEDLIEELRDENLLEETVIDVSRGRNTLQNEAGSNGEFDTGFAVSTVGSGDTDDSREAGFEAIQPDPENGDLSEGEAADQPKIEKPSDEREFYRKRAMEEVSSLQMVEHVISGVEREHMKVAPIPYDDLEAKKALHRFLQLSGDLKSPEHAEAEIALMQETQAWFTALSNRDKNVSVANVRRFCENSRPVLSSQALIALARFYRNSPFSETVRGKFDFVMTRLFSRDIGEDKRRLLFGMFEMTGHIRTLYSNWSSVSYHSSVEDEAEISVSVAQFNGLIQVAEAAQSFDELLEADIFNRIRIYKEDAGELFLAPEVTAAAIDCNIRLGNKYVELIALEKSRDGARSIEEKYGYTYDQIVSNAAGKTLLLVELLRDAKSSEQSAVETEEVFDAPRRAESEPLTAVKKPDKGGLVTGLLRVNKWLLAATVLVAVLSAGLYFWAEKYAGQETSVSVATDIDISGSDLKEHLEKARGTSGTFYGVTQPSWDALSEDKQKEFLGRVSAFASKRGLKRVNLVNHKGKTVAYASEGRFEIHRP